MDIERKCSSRIFCQSKSKLFILQACNMGFGRNIDRKGTPRGTPFNLHDLGRNSLLTLAREGLVGGIPQKAFGWTCRNQELGQQAQTGGKQRRSRKKPYGRRPQGESRGSGYASFAKQRPCQRAARAKMMRRKPWHKGTGFAKVPNLTFRRPNGPLRLQGISANRWAKPFNPNRGPYM